METSSTVGMVKMKRKDFEKLMTYQQISDATGIGVPMLKKMRQRKQLPFYKIGRTIRFRLSEVEQSIQERKVG